ncbi:helix-turn-helix transcriptional regulator [Bacillus sp. V3B]|uniref:helix-turn-helix domain-containing protein n=1 Tax=Bacillus sp. V3B TaxID=2804915 RepID=UPI00210CFA4A|nr:helix-turn-helix transcriptional regulator [Bacillus sp. V3B]MCQ6275784.1 helix-turn-helix transcriptional regulator [Bacillus sp. V3B]
MSFGQIVAEARSRKEVTKDNLAETVNYSRSTWDKWESGDRNIPMHMLPKITESLDDVELYFATWGKATGDVSLPFLNGEYVDQHPTSMMYMVHKETDEAIEQLKSVCWVKPVHARSNQEKEDLKRALFETLDAATSMMTLVAIICREHKFSMRKIFKEWRLTLKARRMAK